MKIDLKARYQRMSDDELVDIVSGRSGEFTDEAIEVARAVLTERGVDQVPTEAVVEAAEPKRRGPLNATSAAVLAAVWGGVTFAVVPEIRDGNLGAAAFFLIAGALLTPVAFWAGRSNAPRA